MKKILSLVLAVVLLCGCVFTLASCGHSLSGTYVGEIDMGFVKASATYEFSGKNFKLTYSGNLGSLSTSLEPQEGTYEIIELDDGSLQISFTIEEDGEPKTSDPVKFVKTDEYIEISGVKFNKKEK